MNYYNPYFYTMPTATVAPRVGLFSRLFGSTGITFGGIVNGTQKFLNIANQAIPLVKQVKPIVGNAKTMFKVMNEFKRVQPTKKENKNSEIKSNNIVNKNDDNGVNDNINIIQSNGPTFFQ